MAIRALEGEGDRAGRDPQCRSPFGRYRAHGSGRASSNGPPGCSCAWREAQAAGRDRFEGHGVEQGTLKTSAPGSGRPRKAHIDVTGPIAEERAPAVTRAVPGSSASSSSHLPDRAAAQFGVVRDVGHCRGRRAAAQFLSAPPLIHDFTFPSSVGLSGFALICPPSGFFGICAPHGTAFPPSANVHTFSHSKLVDADPGATRRSVVPPAPHFGPAGATLTRLAYAADASPRSRNESTPPATWWLVQP